MNKNRINATWNVNLVYPAISLVKKAKFQNNNLCIKKIYFSVRTPNRGHTKISHKNLCVCRSLWLHMIWYVFVRFKSHPKKAITKMIWMSLQIRLQTKKNLGLYEISFSRVRAQKKITRKMFIIFLDKIA